MKTTISAIAVAACIALPGQVAAEGHVNADTVVATVNGTEITLGHMIVLKQRLPAEYQSLPSNVLFDGILDQLVQQTLLGQSSEGLSAGSAKSLENEERALLAAEAIQSLSEEVVSEEALQAAYEEAIGGDDVALEYNASHILVSADDEALARDLIAQLNDGGDFAALAQEHSTGPSASGGGELGWFEAEVMVPPFAEAVVSMEPGTVKQDPVETQFGWHVIRLNDTRKGPSFEEMRAPLADQLRREAIEARVAELTESADLTRATTDDIDPALLDAMSLLED